MSATFGQSAWGVDRESGAASSDPPTIINFVPAVGTPIGRNQAVQFDVIDNSGLFRRIILVATYSGFPEQDLVHDGDAFDSNFSNASNTRTTIANGFRYTLLRDGGWPSAVTVRPFAIDQEGNENL